MEKYYIAVQYAENLSRGVVALTDDEFEAVQKFLQQVNSFEDRSYCGSCYIESEPYNTKEEAWNKLLDEEN